MLAHKNRDEDPILQLWKKFPAKKSPFGKGFFGVCSSSVCWFTTFDKIKNPSFLSETLGFLRDFFDTASSSAKLTKSGESPQTKN